MEWLLSLDAAECNHWLTVGMIIFVVVGMYYCTTPSVAYNWICTKQTFTVISFWLGVNCGVCQMENRLADIQTWLGLEADTLAAWKVVHCIFLPYHPSPNPLLPNKPARKYYPPPPHSSPTSYSHKNKIATKTKKTIPNLHLQLGEDADHIEC